MIRITKPSSALKTTLLASLLGLSMEPIQADTIGYIPYSTVLESYDFRNSQSAGWTFDRITALTPKGIVLGETPPGPPELYDYGAYVGQMYIEAPEGLSYYDSGFEMTFSLPIDSIRPTDGFEFLSMYHNDPRTGFAVIAKNLMGSGLSVQLAPGPNAQNVALWSTWTVADGGAAPEDNWSGGGVLDDGAFHTMALLRGNNGEVRTYVDGKLVGVVPSDNPSNEIQYLGISMNVNGNFYMPFNSVVSGVRAFIVEDRDSDSMPDEWERVYFGDLDRTGSGDFDGDRATDRDEYIAGTNPTAATSVFRVTAESVGVGSSLRVTFPSVVGVTYRFEITPDLGAAFGTFGELKAGTGEVITVSIPEGETQGFIRVVALR